MEEIGFRIDESTGSLPIAELFGKIEGLNSLLLNFEVPREMAVLGKDPDYIGFKERHVIDVTVWAKLRKFKCVYGHEGLFKAWVNIQEMV